MSSIPDFVNGNLPIGRYQLNMQEFEEIFVNGSIFQNSTTRQNRLNALKAILLIFETQIPCKVLNILIGGSFVTSKINPNDLDVVFILDPRSITDSVTFDKIERFFEINRFNVNVQCFHVFWYQEIVPGIGDWDDLLQYRRDRGYWDDFWLRDVPNNERDSQQIQHSFPRKGYIEVSINDFS